MTLQRRLTLSYLVIIGVCGSVMIAVILFALYHVPDYDFSKTVIVTPGTPVVPAFEGSPGWRTITSREDVLRLALWVCLSALAIAMLASTFVARRLSRRVLRPVENVSAAAVRASAGDLQQRLNPSGPPDELRRLAESFDLMLERLQTAFHAQQRFAANAAHELLTPLAMNRTALELLRDNPSGAEVAKLHAILHEANERNIAVTNSLLKLTRVQASTPHSAAVDLSELVRSVVPEGATANIAPNVIVTGDSVLLRQLAENLVGNAVRHNRVDGYVHIGLTAERLTIANSGPAIGPEQLERLFEPFYRASERTGDGHGLGLAIAKAIVEAHRGSITAEANPDGGLTLHVVLPA